MPKEKSTKTVLITGCSPGGIGHALALEFHSKGLHVIATARTREAISDLEARGLSTLSLEVTNPQSISAAVNSVYELTQGSLDILVNNAGRSYVMPGIECDLTQVRETFETNVFAVIAITQAFIPLLIKAQGLILNIGSVAAIMPYVFGSVYNASKAALHAYSQTLRLELEPFGVKVMVAITGGVQSRIARTKRTLKDQSLYLDIEAEFDRRTTHSQEGAMPTDVYARGVVREALQQKPKKWVWRGAKSGQIWFFSKFVGAWIFDKILPKIFGLDRLAKLFFAKRKNV